jgi:vancomycin resistance protein YoaR
MSRIIHKAGIPKPVIAIVIVILLLVLIVGAVFGIAYARGNSNKIFKGVSAYKIDLSDKTEDEARSLIEEYRNKAREKEYKLSFNNNYLIVDGEDVELNIPKKVVDDALAYGRSTDFFTQATNVIKSIFGEKKDFSEDITVNEDIVREKVDSLVGSSGDKAVDDTYKLSGDYIIITKGHDGVAPKYNHVIEKIIEESQEDSESAIIEVEATVNNCQRIDIDWLYDTVYVQKQDAEFTSGGQYKKEVIGVSFSKSEANAKYNQLKPDESTTIKLIKEAPDVTTENLEKVLFADVLASFKTNYAQSNVNRSTNLRLAAESIDGTILLPGETFSYNETVGERTSARGYKMAHIYSGGEVVDGLGGGICQISSTLYNAVLKANLKVVDRTNHMFWPEYVEPGLDATVAWGSIDFKFMNDRNSPVKIVTSAKNGVATAQILGKKEENEPNVVIEKVILETYQPSTQHKEDPTMLVGTQSVVQQPVKGYKVEVYKVLKDSKTGKQISRELVSGKADIYKATDKIIAIGTKAKETTPTPAPQINTPPPQVVTPAPTAAPTAVPVKPTATPKRSKLTPVPAADSGYWPVGWGT